MATRKVCILLAGKGCRMGSYSDWIHKSLLPIAGRAILSRIFTQFDPQSHFVLAVHHFENQIRDFVATAHPHLHIEFVHVENIEGPNTGPGHSLLSCQKSLAEPFYLVCGDTLWEPLDLSSFESTNWLATPEQPMAAGSAYCNLQFDIHGQLCAIKDKQSACENYWRPFVGLAHVHSHQDFFAALSTNTKTIQNEMQLSNGFEAFLHRPCQEIQVAWTDTGTIESFEIARTKAEGPRFEKQHEAIYFENERVIKFFADSTISQRRALRSKINQPFFANVDALNSGFMSYRFIEGQVLSSITDPHVWKRFFHFLQEEFWQPVHSDGAFEENLRIFYVEKTRDRLQTFFTRYPHLENPTVTLNGKTLSNPSALPDMILESAVRLARPSRIHGDLQPENVIVKHDGSFKLIDWRQDFGGNTEVGDLYWDFAKLALWFRLPLSRLDIQANDILCDKDGIQCKAFRFKPNEMNHCFERFSQKNRTSTTHIQNLVTLALLNMAGLHMAPYDLFFFALAAQNFHQNHQPAIMRAS